MRATDDPNNSCIKADWMHLLHEWVSMNECEIHKIDWTRYRLESSKNEKGDRELNWKVVEKG